MLFDFVCLILLFGLGVFTGGVAGWVFLCDRGVLFATWVLLVVCCIGWYLMVVGGVFECFVWCVLCEFNC